MYDYFHHLIGVKERSDFIVSDLVRYQVLGVVIVFETRACWGLGN